MPSTTLRTNSPTDTAPEPMKVKNKSKRIGVAEIARAADVSPSSVSSVLRSPDGRGRVSEKTRLNILRACRDLGYEPRNAPGLNRVYPELGDYCFALSSEAGSTTGFRSGFYSEVLKEVTGALPDPDGHLHFFRFSIETDYLAHPELLPAPIRNNVGSKILCAGAPNLSFVEALRQRKLPVVYLSQAVLLSGVVSVVVDFAGGARQAIDHLVSLGHRRIAIGCGPFSTTSFGILQHRQGVEQAMKAHQLPLQNEYINFCELSNQGGKAMMEEILRHPVRPTAVYCFNDDMAMGAIMHATQNGIRVPEELSVIGFDDTWQAGAFTPPLTTIHAPIREMSQRGVKEMERLSQEPPQSGGMPQVITCPTRLVERNTTARLGS